MKCGKSWNKYRIYRLTVEEGGERKERSDAKGERVLAWVTRKGIGWKRRKSTTRTTTMATFVLGSCLNYELR